MIRKLSKVSFFMTALLTLSMATVPVYAVHALDSNTETEAGASTSTSTSTSKDEVKTETPEKDSSRSAGGEAHIKNTVAVSHRKTATDRAQRQCQNRQKTIKRILGNLAERGQRQTDLFTTIATRVENFATTKNDKPADYDTLVSAVDTQKASAQAAVDSIKADSTDFTCDSTIPKAVSASAKADLQKEIQALKEYRTSVKNLIVGVKTVADKSTDTTKTSTGGTN